MADFERDEGADVLVGRFLKSYRGRCRAQRSAAEPGGLLELMVERGEDHAANVDRVNVSYWEGEFHPAVQDLLSY